MQETVRRQSEDFASYIQLNTTTARAPHEIGGTLFGRTLPRIVMLDNVYLDAIPSGWVLIIHNYDRPGVIGNVGTALARHNINIKRFQLGLPRRGGDTAISFINIDRPPSEEALNEIRNIENVMVVKQVKFND